MERADQLPSSCLCRGSKSTKSNEDGKWTTMPIDDIKCHRAPFVPSQRGEQKHRSRQNSAWLSHITSPRVVLERNCPSPIGVFTTLCTVPLCARDHLQNYAIDVVPPFHQKLINSYQTPCAYCTERELSPHIQFNPGNVVEG
jgi:hypothetical protein